MELHDGSYGLLTVNVGHELYRTGRIKAQDERATANAICREIGYGTGRLLRGPWLKISDDAFSTLTSWCSDADGEAALFSCSNFTRSSIDEMFVDYVACATNDRAMNEIELALYPSIKHEIQKLRDREGIPYLRLFGITARIVVMDENEIAALCRLYNYKYGRLVALVRAYGGFIWNGHPSLRCLTHADGTLEHCANTSALRLLNEWYDGGYILCHNHTKNRSSDLPGTSVFVPIGSRKSARALGQTVGKIQ